MCGRYALSADPDELVEVFDISEIAEDSGESLALTPGQPQADYPQWMRPRFNIAPTQKIPVVVTRGQDHPVRKVAGMYWGLVPSWSKGPGSTRRMINARVETLDEKPVYRTALARRRCILPASGYYEWQHPADKSVPARPFYIEPADGGLLALAGLYDFWRSPQGSWLSSCTIITTEATGEMAAIHNRRPVLLQPDAWGDWLDPSCTDSREALGLIAPLAAGLLSAHPVSRRVNSPRTDDPGLTEPIMAGE
ncbi:SOS response-associated peptidase [Propionibacterium freudenreichii]|uniref:Abasic site processing protein n=1 Tax=Propionibacterium freudenreichii TaxID=1744 RepID=A0A2C7ASW8_9ACTN